MTGAPSPEPVGIVIPVYNHAAYLADAVTSALEQSYPSIEVVVVDDGSDDASAEVARSFADRVHLEQQEHRGIGAARNRGVARTRSQYLSFLDADDRFRRDAIAVLMRALEADPELDAASGHVDEFVDPELASAAAARLRPARRRAPSGPVFASVIRRRALGRVGPFAEHLSVGIAIDWVARARDAGLRTTVVPEVVVERRLHAGNTGLREAASRPELARVLKASLDRRRAALRDA